MPLDWMDVMAAAETEAGGAPGDPARAQELLVDLNEPQRRAVLHGEGPLLILAGAGSGKTRVITRRIAHLVATGRARPQEILAITFTNKAAGEMRQRCAQFFPVAGLWIGTFHATCARLLRREIEVTGRYTRDFSIYDTYERNQLLKECIKALGYDVQRFRPGALGAWISATKNLPFDARRGARAPGGFEGEVYEAVRARYLAAMQAANALDFDDLLLLVLELFDSHPGLRDGYARRFRHVLVDEYQDTNHVQYRLTRHLASFHGNLTVCGDPDQSIYGWRGADIRNILDFERDLGGERPVVVVKLEHNYRSVRPILATAQGLIGHNRARKEKELLATRESERKVRVLECGDENDEARAIVEGVGDALGRGRTPDRIAVFFRTNFMQRALERAFRLAGVPYQIVGGVEFYERREVRDLVSYLRLLVNPRDDAACARVINVPGRGLGEKSVEELVRAASARGLPLCALATAPEALELVRGKARKGLESFAALLRELAPLAAGPAEEALAAIVQKTGYFTHLAQGDDAEAAARVENVEELLAGAREYDLEHPQGGLRGYLEDVALVSDVDGFEEQSPRVTLMTLHSSKGLEFPVVFIAGLEEGLLPHALALDEDPEAGAEEERRLLFVGLTRAMDELTLTHAKMRLHFGETAWQTPSRFLDELPHAWLELPAADDGAEAGPVFVAEEEQDYGELAVGARVEHDHFGYGVVEGTRGEGVNLKVTVHFASAGTRTLMAQYAKLRVVRR